MIVKNKLLQGGKPIHWYVEYLVHAASCVRELTSHSLRIVNTVKLPLNSYHACDLPDDFVDDVSVGFAVGQFIKPMVRRESINPIRLHDDTGAFQTYEARGEAPQQGSTFYGFSPGWNWMWNVNEYGEATGRYFGGGGGDQTNGYKVVRERRQIQFTETVQVDEIVLIYISDGQSADNFSQIDSRAFDAVAAYIDWKSSPNRLNHNSPEGRLYSNKVRLLRAATDSMSIPDIKNIFWESYKATLKN